MLELLVALFCFIAFAVIGERLEYKWRSRHRLEPKCEICGYWANVTHLRNGGLICTHCHEELSSIFEGKLN